jgi:hypothetical protein
MAKRKTKKGIGPGRLVELKWTSGFCNHEECGRLVQHFQERCEDPPQRCPQCENDWQLDDSSALEVPPGLDYCIGTLLGLLTATRWSPRCWIERLLAKSLSPRISDEVVSFGCVLLSVLLFLTAPYCVANPYLASTIVFYLSLRVLMVLAVRLRATLYDCRCNHWRFGSYTRTILLIALHAVEFVFLFAVLFELTDPTLKSTVDPLLLSGATFFFVSLSGSNTFGASIEVVRLFETICAFLLLAVALATVLGGRYPQHKREDG